MRESSLAILAFTVHALVGVGALVLFGAEATPYVIVLSLALLLAVGVGLAQRIRAEIDSRYRRVESMLSIYSVIEPSIPFPMPKEYAASPELLRAVTETIFDARPSLVLELGSGTSTVLGAYALKKLGKGRLISLEHEARFADATNAMLRRHGLEDIAKAVHAPLVPTKVGSETYSWYDTRVLEGLSVEGIDVLVVDGPPGKDQKLARFPAFPVLAPRLSKQARIVVDDARRPDEQEMVRRWVSERADLEAEFVATEKGTIWVRPKAS